MIPFLLALASVAAIVLLLRWLFSSRGGSGANKPPPAKLDHFDVEAIRTADAINEGAALVGEHAALSAEAAADLARIKSLNRQIDWMEEKTEGQPFTGSADDHLLAALTAMRNVDVRDLQEKVSRRRPGARPASGSVDLEDIKYLLNDKKGSEK
ncbi:hypothetical protein GS464_29445 [Rhodococcus hoagii]|nr:hypothetical protein [Prescottella equi]